MTSTEQHPPTCTCRPHVQWRIENDHGGCPLHAAAERMMGALGAIAALATEAPETEEWGGDTEDAESYGVQAGRFEAAEIARAAITQEEGRPPAG